MDSNPKWEIAPGYEAVAEVFVDKADLLGLGGGSFSAQLDGRSVVDLWGGSAAPGRPWEEDTLGVIFSATKGLVGVCVMILVDRGQLDLDALVTDYWPEFGQAGKERTTVLQVLLHTSGLIGLPNHAEILDWSGAGFDDYDAIAAGLAAAPPAWEPGTKQGYHALTYGWIMGELIRRVDGRTVGRFFHEEVAVPLGLDTWIGTPKADLARVAKVVDIGYHAIPRPLRSQVEALQSALRDPKMLNGMAFLGNGTESGVDHLATLVNSPGLLAAEFASGGGTSTARSLARVFAMLGMGGTLEGHTYVSEPTMHRFDKIESHLPDELAREVARSKKQKAEADKPVPRIGPYLGNSDGRLMPPDLFGPNPHAMGAAGAGGQLVFFDRDHGLAMASIRSHMAILDLHALALIDAVYECAAKNGDIDGSKLRKDPLRRKAVKAPMYAYLARLERKSLTPPPS
jgi:CubicO group peptidase (beta-lactamase class C family)